MAFDNLAFCILVATLTFSVLATQETGRLTTVFALTQDDTLIFERSMRTYSIMGDSSPVVNYFDTSAGQNRSDSDTHRFPLS